MADDKAGFKISGEFYSWPEGFRLGDPVLIREVTGLEWTEFMEAMDSGTIEDPSVINGMIAAAIWQANPKWTREKARRFVEQINFEEFESIGEEDENPPTEPAGSLSVGSPAASSPEPAEK